MAVMESMNQDVMRPSGLRRWIGPTYRARPGERVGWATAATVCIIVLCTAAWLTPSATGMGTHEGLGLPPCGFAYTSGMPCPTCGMTTSFSLAVRGRVLAAIVTQPAGFVLFLATGIVAFYGWLIALGGRAVWINWDRISARLMITLVLVVFLGWGFKIGHGAWTGALGAN